MLSIDELVKIIVTVVIAVLGWIIGHYFTTMRDRKNKKREISLQHLISAYRILTDDVGNRPNSEGMYLKLEQVLTDIQLFGSKEQIELVKQSIRQFQQNRTLELDPIINSLRYDLRKQLGLSEIDGNVTWLRVT